MVIVIFRHCYFYIMRACASLILRERIGPVLLIGINRPHKLNCVNNETAKELNFAFEEFESCVDAKVAVLHGVGGNFCSGADLGEISGAPGDQSTSTSERGKELVRYLKNLKHGPMGPTHRQFKKPTIAAINGYAVAGGMELALMCDLRVMEESAIMGVYCRRFGVPLLDGGTVRLPAIVGLSRALDLILTGRKVTATEAGQMGLANRVVKDGTAIGIAVQLGQEIASFPQQCMLADRASVYHSVFQAQSQQEALMFESENGLPIVETESVAGAARFMKGEGRGGKTDVKPVNK